MTPSNRFIVPLFLSILVAVLGEGWSAQAAQVPIVPSPSLDDLVDDPLDPADDPDAFLVSASGRFRFDNFSFTAAPPDGGIVPSAEDVFVTVTETAETVMLLFQVVGRNLAAGPAAFDLQIGYDAQTLDPLDSFVGHTLFMNGRGFGDGTVAINEEILSDEDVLLAELTTFSNVPNVGTQVIDSAGFGPRQVSVTVDKDIALNGGTADGNGVAFLSHFKETFDVERVPEPGTALLFVFGALGVGIIARATHRT